MREKYKFIDRNLPKAFVYRLHFQKIINPRRKKIRDRKANALM